MSEQSVPKQRNRNLLKQFYGNKKEDTTDRSADINSDQFDADIYMKVTFFFFNNLISLLLSISLFSFQYVFQYLRKTRFVTNF